MKPSRPSEPYWLLAPMLVFFAAFFLYPLLSALKTSFYAWDLLTPPRFVGLANYRAILDSGELFSSLGTTLLVSAVVVLGSLVLGLALALAVNRPGRVAALARSAVFSAYVVSWVSVGLLFLWIFDADAGVVNRALGVVGVAPIRWLTSTALAPLTVALIVIWKVTGYAMVVFLYSVSGRSELALGAQIGDDLVDADLVDQTQSGVADAQAHPAVLGLHPETAVLQVRQEPALGFVVGVGDIVPDHGLLARDLTDACHDASPIG